ncbi:helix-turn-helix domain-containing protein [Clostridium grantii]|uniref:Transcriptional regulator, IclR family n=1 Tax=Clostridium grantii DSM 8605 TaxID=1121316 RepID=A0A1M5T4H3_9CLOT|nr:IclR family transcriptional regulator C-terminal domain-containing protein [Clostridium grantii]SHH45639.1 transcriptional regulator, IclR family [Clostridium grantii DSM 8605]
MDKSPAPALSIGLNVLELIAQNGALGFNELCELTGKNSTTMSRITKVLVDTFYIKKNNNGKYVLGYKLLTLKDGNSKWDNMLSKSNEALSDITNKFQVTSLLIGFENNVVIALDKKSHNNSPSLQRKGTISKQYINRPWGFVYTASLPLEQMMIFIHKIKSELIDDDLISDELMWEYLNFTRENNYSDDLGKLCKGIRRIAVPVYDYNQKVIASLVAAFISEALDDNKVNLLIDYLNLKASEITK